MRSTCFALAVVLLLLPAAAFGKKKSKEKAATPAAEPAITTTTFAGLPLRELGPAVTSGRIVDLAVQPDNPSIYYAAAAAGGVWKTTNAGTTWTPIFDEQGSSSIGCVTLDPSNPHTVWVGTGENNSQRSVGYGDGVYKSLDGGQSWTHMGLAHSEHIGMIQVDPRDSQVVWVAAQGPLWNAGGDRGLYKTSDGGETWQLSLEIDEHTGVSEVLLDPRQPDTLYAVTYQRRRRVWNLINGGPGGGVHKSTDGGEHWRRLEGGLPSGDVGRIGLAVAPSNPDLLYAIVEASGEDGGFFRSTDRGESWQRRSDYTSGSPQYYQELIVDPHRPERIYSMDTWMQVSEDGGSTWNGVGETFKHVDNHALWIDPEDTGHLRNGCDGGIYETWDRGATWSFIANLPVTQFYKLALDDARPFYNIYGGTQDNFTLGGPSRTTSGAGIINSDWFVTVGGDGFEPAVDPKDPNIVYAQWQHGNLVRHDRRSGEIIEIQPKLGPDEPPLIWNWDAPLLISPHSPSRLYFAANRVFRSDDRGDSWRAISPDLSRQLDRNQLELMGRVWEEGAVARGRSTSNYGNLVALTESSRIAGLLYAGSDDGLIQVSEDGGQHWRREESFPGIPERTYVNALVTSRHHADTVYAVFNNHKSGDFAPYLLKSTDRGRSWVSITGDLPERGSTYALAEDPEHPELLFAGTEFGAFFTLDGGERWFQLTGGLPTVAVRDLEIQEREVDLVLGTFGRGFWVLDDYSPLRGLTVEQLDQQQALAFPVKDTSVFITAFPLGTPGKSFQGDGLFAAENPPNGAVFTYYLAKGLQTREERRHEAESDAREAGEATTFPSWDELRAEDREIAPTVRLTVRDATGAVIRRLTGPVSAGFHRISWDLRFPTPEPTELEPQAPGPFSPPRQGPLTVPGVLTVEMATVVDGVAAPFGEPQNFTTAPLGSATLAAADRAELSKFQRQTASLQRAMLGAIYSVDETEGRLALVERSILEAPAADLALLERARALGDQLHQISTELSGDSTLRSRSTPTPPSISSCVDDIVSGHWNSTSAPTESYRTAYQVASKALAPLLTRLRQLVEVDLRQLEGELEDAGGNWTPGRVPRWTVEGRD